MSDISSRPCFTVTEAAKFLKISRSLFYKLVHDGRIKTVKVGARTIVRAPELDRFLDEQQGVDPAQLSTRGASAGVLS